MLPRRHPALAVIAGLLVINLFEVASADAQAPPDSGPPAAPAEPLPPAVVVREQSGEVTARATRIREPIRIDGRLDDLAYEEVLPIGGFIQQEPREGEPTSEQTDVWVLFDDTNLYVTCRCWEAHLDQLVANEMRRDIVATGQHDHLAVAFDTFHDGRNGYFFLVTAAGGTFDALMNNERVFNGDWNGVWDFRHGRFDGGWTIEMKIPFKSLRYGPGRDQTWGLQFRRLIRHRNETTLLTGMPAAFGVRAIMQMSRAARLIGLQVPPPGNNLEIKPYAITDLRTDRQASPHISNDVGADAGGDVKYGVTNGLTLDLTYNTDFAQVEDDEAQVNLTRFNLFFPEKREFFLEGQGVYGFGGAGAFNPGRVQATSVTPIMFFSRRIGLNEGREVPIIGGARLTGRAGRYSLGLLNIQTGDEPLARAQSTNFSVVRLRRDILRRSNVGALLTHRTRGLSGGGSNTLAGVDALFTFFEFLNINSFMAKTDTPGSRGNDLSYQVNANYGADRYGLELEHLTAQPNFNPEMGFLRRRDFRRNYALGRFSPRPSRARVIRKYTYQAGFEHITDNDGTLESRESQGTFQIDLQSGDSITAEYSRNFELVEQPFTISEDAFVPVGAYEFQNLRTAYSLGQQHRISGTAAFETGSFYGGDKQTASFSGRAEITIPFAVEPTVSLNWIELPFTKLLTTLVSTRTTYAFTPRMFVSALVQYSSATTSLSANLRFRWEYLPGSELFVVYTEGRDTFPVPRIDLENRGFVVKINRLFRF